jgi:hypothetical protein
MKDTQRGKERSFPVTRTQLDLMQNSTYRRSRGRNKAVRVAASWRRFRWEIPDKYRCQPLPLYIPISHTKIRFGVTGNDDEHLDFGLVLMWDKRLAIATTLATSSLCNKV